MKYILILFLTILFSVNIFSRENSGEVVIQGLLVSKDNCPLPDVLINVTDTDIQTKTDKDGNFVLVCPIESNLHFYVDSKEYYTFVSKFIQNKRSYEQRYTFITDFKRNQKCTQLKSTNKKMFLTESSYSPLVPVAYYNTNIEDITLKYFNRYRK